MRLILWLVALCYNIASALPSPSVDTSIPDLPDYSAVLDRWSFANNVIFPKTSVKNSESRLSNLAMKAVRDATSYVQVQESDLTAQWWNWEMGPAKRHWFWGSFSSRPSNLRGAYVEYTPSNGMETTNTVWYFHHQETSVLLSHGMFQGWADRLQARLIVLEYAGYGVLRGKRPTQLKVLAAHRAVIRHFVQSKRLQMDGNTVIWGDGIGAAIAVDILDGLKRRNLALDVAGVVLTSPFTEVRAWIKDGRPGQWYYDWIPNYLNVKDKLKHIASEVHLVCSYAKIEAAQCEALMDLRQKLHLPSRMSIIHGYDVQRIQKEGLNVVSSLLPPPGNDPFDPETNLNVWIKLSKDEMLGLYIIKDESPDERIVASVFDRLVEAHGLESLGMSLDRFTELMLSKQYEMESMILNENNIKGAARKFTDFLATFNIDASSHEWPLVLKLAEIYGRTAPSLFGEKMQSSSTSFIEDMCSTTPCGESLRQDEDEEAHEIYPRDLGYESHYTMTADELANAFDINELEPNMDVRRVLFETLKRSPSPRIRSFSYEAFDDKLNSLNEKLDRKMKSSNRAITTRAISGAQFYAEELRRDFGLKHESLAVLVEKLKLIYGSQ